jgi:hypothetical protein
MCAYSSMGDAMHIAGIVALGVCVYVADVLMTLHRRLDK